MLLETQWTRTLRISERSKRWLKKREWKELRKKTRKDKGARQGLVKEIKKGKAEEQVDRRGKGCIQHSGDLQEPIPNEGKVRLN